MIMRKFHRKLNLLNLVSRKEIFYALPFAFGSYLPPQNYIVIFTLLLESYVSSIF